MAIAITIYITCQINALKAAGVHVAESPAKIGEVMKQVRIYLSLSDLHGNITAALQAMQQAGRL